MKPPGQRARIAMVVLGGFLGSGKTTLLNALLGQPGLPRLCVLVNDFGALQVDAALIRSRSDDVIELDNGCICCSLGDALTQRLLEVSQREPAPELLIIEASGVSDPLRIAQLGLLDAAFSLNAVVVAVDAEHIEQQLRDQRIAPMLLRQIDGAGVIALTRVDRVTPARLQQARRLLERLNPRVPVLAAPRGELARRVFVDEPAAAPQPRREAWLGSGDWRSAAPPHDGLASVAVAAQRLFDRPRLKAALRELPGRLLRAKGIVRLDGRPGTWLLQMVSGRIAWSPAPPTQRLGIVLIGCFDEHDGQLLARRIGAAMVDASQPLEQVTLLDAG